MTEMGKRSPTYLYWCLILQDLICTLDWLEHMWIWILYDSWIWKYQPVFTMCPQNCTHFKYVKKAPTKLHLVLHRPSINRIWHWGSIQERADPDQCGLEQTWVNCSCMWLCVLQNLKTSFSAKIHLSVHTNIYISNGNTLVVLRVMIEEVLNRKRCKRHKTGFIWWCNPSPTDTSFCSFCV